MITKPDWINHLKDNARGAARDAVRKENSVIKRATSELTKKVAASQKVEKSAAGKLNMLNKQLLLLESAESAWEQGPNKCNSSQLQALVVSRQGFMQRGNKAAVVRASPAEPRLSCLSSILPPALLERRVGGAAEFGTLGVDCTVGAGD